MSHAQRVTDTPQRETDVDTDTTPDPTAPDDGQNVTKQDTPQDQGPPAEQAEQDSPAGTDTLGDKGKKALDAMKADRNAARTEAREVREKLDALQAQVDGREAEHKKEQERRRIQDDALSKANERILRSEVRAAAAAKLTDRDDALRYLDLSSFEVGEDGDVDAEAITKAIDDLITERPYLSSATAQRWQGTADGGARNGATRPTQLTRADLSGMTAEEIRSAKQAGQLDHVLGVKH